MHPGCTSLTLITEVACGCADVQQQYLAQLQAGQDCLLQAPTGSGKTLTFLLPTLSRLEYACAGDARQVCTHIFIGGLSISVKVVASCCQDVYGL